MTAVNIKLQLITYIRSCYALRAGSANALFKVEMHPDGKAPSLVGEGERDCAARTLCERWEGMEFLGGGAIVGWEWGDAIVR
jgi:hypothetical protein